MNSTQKFNGIWGLTFHIVQAGIYQDLEQLMRILTLKSLLLPHANGNTVSTVVAISAPDTFLFPRNYGESLDDVLKRLDPEVYSGVEIPMMLSHSRLKKEDEDKHVLERWRVLDNVDEPYHHHRSIPLYNPLV